MKPWRKLAAALLGLPILILGMGAGYLYLFQESIIFVGSTLADNHKFNFDVPFEELVIPVDGAEISALHFQQPEPRGLVFFLHGNGGNLDSWTSNVDYYERVNYDLFIFDYRGYGKSSGTIESEQQLHNDVRVAWDSVADRYRGKPIVIYGRSLGSALATQLASEVDPDLLILVSPFSSMLAMARREYPLLPDWLVRYPLRTDRLVGRVESPVVLVHGDQDQFIPMGHSRELLSLANPSARLLIVEGAGHNDIHLFDSYLDGLTRALPDQVSADRNVSGF